LVRILKRRTVHSSNLSLHLVVEEDKVLKDSITDLALSRRDIELGLYLSYIQKKGIKMKLIET